MPHEPTPTVLTVDAITPAPEPRSELPQFLEAFAAIHTAMRRDVDRLVLTVDRTRSPAELAALGPWFTRFRAAIEHHHSREDHVVWPELLRRDPTFLDAAEVLVADHHELDDALAAVDAALAPPTDHALVGGRSESARVAAADLRRVLREHLDREEAAAFGRLARCFTDEEYGRLEHQMMRTMSIRDLAFTVPWVLDGIEPEARARLLRTLPAPVRALQRLVFEPAYARTCRPLAVTP